MVREWRQQVFEAGSARTPESAFPTSRPYFSLPRISIHVQETGTPGELLVTRGGSLTPTAPEEAPAAAPPGPRGCPQAPGTESEGQIPQGALEVSPLWEPGGDGGARAEEKQGPAAEPARGPGGARRDEGDTAGAPGLQQDGGPGAGSPGPGRDCTAGDPGSTEAGWGPPLGAEAGSVVVGKCGRCCGSPVSRVGGLLLGASLRLAGRDHVGLGGLQARGTLLVPPRAGDAAAELRLAIDVGEGGTRGLCWGVSQSTCLPEPIPTAVALHGDRDALVESRCIQPAVLYSSPGGEEGPGG